MTDNAKTENEAPEQVQEPAKGRSEAGIAVDEGSEERSKLSAVLRSASGLAAPVLISLIVSVAVSAMALGVYDKTRKGDFAVIDLAGIVELEQLRLTASVLKQGTTDDDRLKAFQRVQQFGNVLEKAIEEIKADCKCVLLARNAFIGGGGTDYTESLKQKVGLGGVDIEAVRKMTEAAVNRAVPSPDSMKSTAGQPSNAALGAGKP
jgi:hypothetical protein